MPRRVRLCPGRTEPESSAPDDLPRRAERTATIPTQLATADGADALLAGGANDWRELWNLHSDAEYGGTSSSTLVQARSVAPPTRGRPCCSTVQCTSPIHQSHTPTRQPTDSTAHKKIAGGLRMGGAWAAHVPTDSCLILRIYILWGA